MMMKSLIALGLAACFVSAAPCGARAQDSLPDADFRADAMIRDVQAGEWISADVRHSNGRFRVEGAYRGQPAVILFDAGGGPAQVLLGGGGMGVAVEAPADAVRARALNAAGSRRATGVDRIAGEACTVYDIVEPETGQRVEACMTADDIVLRAATPEDGDVYEVRSLSRTAQDAALFEVPSTHSRMRLNDLEALAPLFGGRR